MDDHKFKAGCLATVLAFVGFVIFGVIVSIARGGDVKDDGSDDVAWIALALFGVVMLVAWFFTSRD